jgi:hypothetical protein
MPSSESLTPPEISTGASLRPTDEMPDLLGDCQIMLRFALKEGLLIPDDVRRQIALLDQVLVKLNLPTISAMPRTLINDAQAPALPGPAELPSELLLSVHGALSRIVAPATALTLQVSEPPPGKHRFLGGLPILVSAASWTALICAMGFVATSIPTTTKRLEKAVEAAASKITPTPTPSPTATPIPSP